MHPPIAVNDLTVAYGDFTAVDSVSFDVQPGEIFALLGTNGAGKTSIMETLQGHRTPAKGTVTLWGETPWAPSVRSRCGIMLQETGYAAELTVRETIELCGALSGRHDNTDRVIEQALLGPKVTTRVGQLSGGEKRRLDFATAIYGQPDLLFLDEPTAALDPESRAALWECIVELNRAGATIMLTTHYLEEAEAHAERIALLHQGQLHALGTVRELVNSLPATISFDAADDGLHSEVSSPGLTPPELTPPGLTPPGLTPPGFQRHGQRWQKQVENLQQELGELLQWAERDHVTLERLHANSSSLSDVFTHMAKETA